MAQSAKGAPGGVSQSDVESLAAPIATGAAAANDDRALPLPGWLTKLYFIFPVVLYIPDAIFNYYVYSHGVSSGGGMVSQVFWSVVWGFVAIGVVGMAYLLSVLAPWHWSMGHRFQAFFCGVGVVVATIITTWNSLAYRSQSFQDTFKTDQWVYQAWPQLHAAGISVTMVLVSVAPPFWGLFWAIVQPTEKNRNLRHLQESHAERILRTQQEAELKRIRAEANVKVREAQLRGMAATAATARQQAAGLMGQMRQNEQREGVDAPQAVAQIEASEEPAPALPAPGPATIAEAPTVISASSLESAPESEPTRLFTPSRGREVTGAARGGREMYNHAAPVTTARVEQANRPVAAQPSLLSDAAPDTTGIVPGADVSGSWPQRPRPSVGQGVAAFFPTDTDAMTGTTGPRPAIRRANEPSQLLRAMNEPHARTVEQVDETVAELRAAGLLQPTQRDVIARLSEKYGLDETTARRMASIYKQAKRGGRE